MNLTKVAAMKILSMGWGVQTWTLAAKIAQGEMEPVDFMVFADTGHEGAETYAFAERWTPWLEERGCSVITVHAERTDVVREDWTRPGVMIPAFTFDAATGNPGQVRRQCTDDWKIAPIRRFIRGELVRQGLRRTPGIVETLQGISRDEWMRMRTSDVAYITHRYPLVDQGLTRTDCKVWLEEQGLPLPPKSACTFCPFHSVAAWQQLKRDGGSDWREAVAVDAIVRDKRPDHGPLFVHPHRKPLAEAVAIPEDEGASQLSFEDSCDSGFCFT